MMKMWKVTITLERVLDEDLVYCFVAMSDTKEGAIEQSFDEFEYTPDCKTRRVVVGEIKSGVLQIGVQ